MSRPARQFPDIQSFMRVLEERGELNRALEFLPSDAQLERRMARGTGLTSPECSVLMAYSKLALKADLTTSGLVDDPWFAMFLAAEDARGEGENELTPYWVYPDPEGAAIERYVPAMPLSKEVQKYRRLMRTVGGYRMVIGQPRQEDLLRYLGERDVDVSSVAIDLRPPPAARTGTPDVG